MTDLSASASRQSIVWLFEGLLGFNDIDCTTLVLLELGRYGTASCNGHELACTPLDFTSRRGPVCQSQAHGRRPLHQACQGLI